MLAEKRSKLIKKLLYQSSNRGCKETDLILGNFANQTLDHMADDELEIFAKILALPDNDIYDYYTGKKQVTPEFDSKVMHQIIQFNPNK
ncbi:MAG: succinate dehydrogenase assembly factor 2 [Rickettsiaceae bacterium]|nr:succinate dehydrogenase assembly factor 2 [Rickettsiaceae bacterium]